MRLISFCFCALWLRTRRRSFRLFRLIEIGGGADERFERALVDLVALIDVDRASHVAFEAGVEQARRILERGAVGEGQLHDSLVGLAGAEMPACSNTGTPRHFHSSTTSGQASLMRPRTRASVAPRQSPSSLIRPSIAGRERLRLFFLHACLALLHDVAFVINVVASATTTGIRACRSSRAMFVARLCPVTKRVIAAIVGNKVGPLAKPSGACAFIAASTCLMATNSLHN